MDKSEAKLKINELKEKLEYYAKKYYDDDKPEISDYEYDMMMNELKKLEKDFPDLITKDSLTQKVGGHVKEGFKQVEHEVPLQSLQDVFSFDELRDFDDRVKKQLNGRKKFKICCRNKNRRIINGNRIQKWRICKSCNERKWLNW